MNGRAEPGDWSYPIRLLEKTGVEIEYMIVDASSLDVRPIADELLRAAAGGTDFVADVEPTPGDGIGWSNELVLHVLELKTLDPVTALGGLAARFQSHVARAERLLEPLGARLLPTAAHPWMRPESETRLWPHESSAVYEALDRIFSCRGHGWSNLQSTHVNLPFGNDAEFGRLHAAVRLVLPLLPALAASSPLLDGTLTGLADSRLDAYRRNCARVPSVTGRIVPEPVYDRRTYEGELLDGIYRDLAPLDRGDVLRHEWVNARGAIARFDRGSIEIRLLDVQECPVADLAIVALARRAIEALLAERWVPMDEVKRADTSALAATLRATIREAEATRELAPALLRAFGIVDQKVSARDVWIHLTDRLLPDHPEFTPVLRHIERQGTLASRILRRLGRAGAEPAATGRSAERTPIPRAEVRAVYADLAACLRSGSLFDVARSASSTSP